ncbi:glycosyltransferase domain-containing protein [Caballeronia sp. GAWG1-1]|uniref:glycosyltransferase domain-containing protein n=1 Tax=Caballeronia sp. GAWG1-1 TaxID=2921742 RepID=UPI0020288C57|nr:glycosyltransferase domain-containing protein [Caballeronia sp. GAWG1-1]
MNLKKACVYTCLIGEYETLNEVQASGESGLPHICFTDSPSLQSDTWEIRVVCPAFPMDSVRSQRRIKILAQEYLSEFDVSLYVDNTVQLKVPAEQIIARYLGDADIALPWHTLRGTLLDEFIAVAREGLDEPARVFEQLSHYQLLNFDLLLQRPYWTGVMIRRHDRHRALGAMTDWYNQVMRYSRRDQLSVNLALSAPGLAISTFDTDILSSWFHEWPVVAGRNQRKRQYDIAMSGAPLLAQYRAQALDVQDDAIGDRERTIAELSAQVAELSQDIAKKEQFILELSRKVPFNEAAYLARYPDVAEAVVRGHIPSGLAHYEAHGRKEGRLPI